MTALEIFEKYKSIIAFLSTFIIALIFSFTEFWWFALIAGIIGGVLHTNAKFGSLNGLLGVMSAWITNILYETSTSKIYTLIDQLGTFILGSSGKAIILVLIIIIVGGLFGLLGGYLGTNIALLVKKADMESK